MDKEKEIEDMAIELEKGRDYPFINTPREMAERLVLVGYGNIETARKEIAKSYEARVIEVMHDYFRELESGETKFADVYELSVNAVKAITKDFEE